MQVNQMVNTIYAKISFQIQHSLLKFFFDYLLSGYEFNTYSLKKRQITQKLLKIPISSTVHKKVCNILIHIHPSKLLLTCIFH